MLHSIKFGARLAILLAVSVILVAAIGATGILGGHHLSRGIETVYDNRVVPLGQLAQIQDGINRVGSGVSTIVLSDSRFTLMRMEKDIAAAEAEVERLGDGCNRAAGRQPRRGRPVAALQVTR